MRMEKKMRIAKKVRRKKTRNVDGTKKINKQHWPRLIFFSLPNNEPVVPAITGQNAECYHISILKRCNSRSSLSLLSGVIAIFYLTFTLLGISLLSR